MTEEKTLSERNEYLYKNDVTKFTPIPDDFPGFKIIDGKRIYDYYAVNQWFDERYEK